MLDKIFKTMTYSRGITSKSFLKNCLFIINSDENQEISEKIFNQAKAYILYITTSLSTLKK